MSEEEIKDDAAAPAPEAAEAAPVAEEPTAETAEVKEETPATEETAEAPAAEEEAPKTPEKKRDIFAELLGEEEEGVRVHKAKKSKNVQTGIVHITATFNNTLVSVTTSMAMPSAGPALVRWASKVLVKALHTLPRLSLKTLAAKQ